MTVDFRTLGTPELEAIARMMRDEAYRCHAQALLWRKRATPYSEAARQVGVVLVERRGRPEVDAC